MSKYASLLIRGSILRVPELGNKARSSIFSTMRSIAFFLLIIMSLQTGGAESSGLHPAVPCIGGSPEHATMHSRRVVLGAPIRAGGEAPALLTVPQGWSQGCSAAILTWEGVEPAGPRNRLIEGLIEQGLAVLELDVSTPFGFSADSGRVPTVPLSPPDIIPLLFGALRELRVEGAGTVIVLGFGLGGAAGLEAAALSAARAEGFTAAGELGPGGSFRVGRTAEETKWPIEATRICRIVAIATRLPTSCLADWIPAPGKGAMP